METTKDGMPKKQRCPKCGNYFSFSSRRIRDKNGRVYGCDRCTFVSR